MTTPDIFKTFDTLQESDNSQKIGSTKQKFESAKSENTGGND